MNESPTAAGGARSAVSSLDVVSLPWVFTQHHPLDVDDFITQARVRGIELDPLKLRELYRHGVLVPFVGITRRRMTAPESMTRDEPQFVVSRLANLCAARAEGRLVDLDAGAYDPRIQFTPPQPARRGWWNGLLYSHHQLIILPRLQGILARCRYSHRNGRLRPRLEAPDPFLAHRAAWYHRIALMATALEARYLPVLDPEWVHLVNATEKDHRQYRDVFDPGAMSQLLRYTPEEVRKDAEELLAHAHWIEPMSGSWSQLLRRAPRDSWKDLRGAGRSAMDLRETAEILLCFYEDLNRTGQASPLPLIPPTGWHPLHERLSCRRETLDQDLMNLGLSPHPRVVLAVEGETEESHLPKIWRKLGYPAAPELVRLLKLGSSDKDPSKIAALASTPLVTRMDASSEFWWVARPPSRFMVVMDPENKFSPEKINRTRTLILKEIRDGLALQGAKAAEEELNELVDLRTWQASCYEFEHFTDNELADAIESVHETINGWSRQELIAALSFWRGLGKDIKRVWESGRWDSVKGKTSGPWTYHVSKSNLADALWPILERKIEAAMANAEAPVPAIVQAVADAFVTAQDWRYKTFVLTAAESDS